MNRHDDRRLVVIALFRFTIEVIHAIFGVVYRGNHEILRTAIFPSMTEGEARRWQPACDRWCRRRRRCAGRDAARIAMSSHTQDDEPADGWPQDTTRSPWRRK